MDILVLQVKNFSGHGVQRVSLYHCRTSRYVFKSNRLNTTFKRFVSGGGGRRAQSITEARGANDSHTFHGGQCSYGEATQTPSPL